MTEQLTLFPPTRRMYRRTNPSTSREAAERVVDGRSDLQRLILSLIRATPMTDIEIEKRPEIKALDLSASTARKRRTELFQAGLIEACGRRNGATVWRVKA